MIPLRAQAIEWSQSYIQILNVSELKHGLVLKRLNFEYTFNIKYMPDEYHMGRAAAGSNRRGATCVVFM